MEPIGDDLKRELGRFGPQGGIGDAVAAWPGAVGPEIARNAWPARTQADGTLVVHVRDAIWGFELTQQAEEIRARIPGRPRLKFVPGELPDEAPPTPPAALPAPTADQVREVDEMTATIGDRELRESVAKVIKAALVRTRDDRPI